MRLFTNNASYGRERIVAKDSVSRHIFWAIGFGCAAILLVVLKTESSIVGVLFASLFGLSSLWFVWEASTAKRPLFSAFVNGTALHNEDSAFHLFNVV